MSSSVSVTSGPGTADKPGTADRPKSSDSNKAAAGIGLSRVFGLVREILIGATLGIGPAADGFRVAMRVPNIIQNLLGEGALSASFVPVYAKLIEDKNEVEARRVAGGVLGFLLVAIIAIVAIIVVFAGPIVTITTLGQLSPDVQEQAVTLTRITAPGIGLLGVSAWCLGILNANRQYFLSYVAPVLWNLAQIVTLITVALIGLTFGDDLTPARIAVFLAIAVTVGSALQLAIQLPTVLRLTHGVTPHLRREGQVKVVLRRFAPAVGTRGVVQVASFIDLMLAGIAGSGALAILGMTMPLYLLPVSLFGFSVAATELTEMSRRSDHLDEFIRRSEIGFRKVILPAGLCAGILAGGARPIIGTLYQWPSQVLDLSPITNDETIVIGLVLLTFALALPATMAARVTQNALYALGEVRTPATIAVIRLVVLVVVTLPIMARLNEVTVIDGEFSGWSENPSVFFFPDELMTFDLARLGAVGIALGALVASWVEWALLRRALQNRVGHHLSSGLVLPVTAASLGTAVALWLLQVVIPIGAPIEGIVVGLAGIPIYIGLLRLQGLRPLSRS